MVEVTIVEKNLVKAADGGMDAFLKVFVDAIYDAIGGELTEETMSLLNSDQITLLAWQILHDELMDGGFVQLIHNGYGPFIFKNPFAKAMKQWGVADLSKLLYDAHRLYSEHHAVIEQDCTDEEFMSLFERFPAFDDLDDAFVENEEQWTADVAHYVDEHLERFAVVQSTPLTIS